jgi:hypothetical protein
MSSFLKKFKTETGFTKMTDNPTAPLNADTINSSSTTTTTCSTENPTFIRPEFYESGDVILQQGDVIDKILRISDKGPNQTECILMTRTWSDGTTEEIGRLSSGDYIGLLFYSGFGFMVEDSLVTYTCVKDNVRCDLVSLDLQGGKCTEIMKREMFKVVPGFCLLSETWLTAIINDHNVCKFVNYVSIKDSSNKSVPEKIDANNKELKGKKIIEKGNSADKCYILLSGIVRPGSLKPSLYRDKEILEIFGEAKFRNASATRSGDMYAIGNNTSYLEIDVGELITKLADTDYFEKIASALRYRGNIMDFQKNNKSMYFNYETIAQNSQITTNQTQNSQTTTN